MDNQTVRQFAQALQLYDTSVTAKEAEDIMFQELNKLTPEELEKFVNAAQKVSTVNEAEDSIKRTIKDLFNEIFPALSFYPALGIWGIVDKLIQNGDLSSLDTADRSKLAVYAAIFFGMVGGKIAYNRIKEKVKEIDNADAQISETLRLAGVQLDEEIYNPGKDEIDNGQDLDDEKIAQSVREIVQDEHIPLSAAMKKYSEITNISLDIIQNALENTGDAEVEDWELHYGDYQSEYKIFRDKKTGKGESFPLHESEDNIDWSVRDGVNKLSSEKGMWMWDAEKAYAEEHGMDTGLVHDLYQYGDEHFTLDQAKKELEATEDEFEREQYADDYLYSNGGWNAYQNRINYLKRVIKRLEEKEPIKESYESEIRGNGKIDRELAEQPWAKNPPEINEEEWELVSYKDFDIIVYHYHEGSDEEDEKFEVEIYPKGQADDTKPPIDYMNSHSWIKCLEKISEVANKDKPSNTEEPEDDGDEYDSDYTKVDPEATKELSEWMNKWVAKTPLEQAIKYVNDGMKAKYGREYPKEEDESDYRRELCSAAAKKFNISLDKITDKIASDYVDSMPYVIQDKQGNYSEI